MSSRSRLTRLATRPKKFFLRKVLKIEKLLIDCNTLLTHRSFKFPQLTLGVPINKKILALDPMLADTNALAKIDKEICKTRRMTSHTTSLEHAIISPLIPFRASNQLRKKSRKPLVHFSRPRSAVVKRAATFRRDWFSLNKSAEL